MFTYYLGIFQYENNNLDCCFHAEGRCMNVGGTYVYQYDVKDHLGNTRATFDVPTGTTARRVQATQAHFSLP